jgi:hypothetical protein
VSNGSRSINKWTSEIAVNIGEKGQRFVFVFSLDDSALGSGLGGEGRVESHLQALENLVLKNRSTVSVRLLIKVFLMKKNSLDLLGPFKN